MGAHRNGCRPGQAAVVPPIVRLVQVPATGVIGVSRRAGRHGADGLGFEDIGRLGETVDMHHESHNGLRRRGPSTM